jgi:hypothetical protein
MENMRVAEVDQANDPIKHPEVESYRGTKNLKNAGSVLPKRVELGIETLTFVGLQETQPVGEGFLLFFVPCGVFAFHQLMG